MKPTNFDKQEILAGITVVVIGSIYLIQGSFYSLGTARSMGPGYFPLILGLLFVATGVGILFVEARNRNMVKEDTSQGKGGAWRALIALPASVLVFAWTVEKSGLALATFLAVLTSTFADKTIGLVKSLAIAVIMTAACILIFRIGLGIQVRIFPW